MSRHAGASASAGRTARDLLIVALHLAIATALLGFVAVGVWVLALPPIADNHRAEAGRFTFGTMFILAGGGLSVSIFFENLKQLFVSVAKFIQRKRVRP